MAKRNVRIDRFDKRIALSTLRPYVHAFQERLLTPFSKIEDEAERAANEYYINAPGDEDTDPSAAAETAQEIGLEVYEDLTFVRQQLVQLWTAGLYHLWERTLKGCLRRELRWLDPANHDFERADFPRIVESLSDWGADLRQLTCFPRLNELRLVANTVKHGDGPSCLELYALRKSLFDVDRDRPEFTLDFGEPRAEDLNLNSEDFAEYSTAVEKFWTEIDELTARNILE